MSGCGCGVRCDIVELDVSRGASRRGAPVVYRQGDAGALLAVCLTSSGVPVDLDGLTVRLVCSCPAGLVRAEMAASGSKATYVVGPPLTTEPASLYPYVEVSRGGVLVASTDRFAVRVDEADDIRDDEVPRYRSEVDSLIEAVQRAADGLAGRAESGEFDGRDGATFFPSVDGDGVISWTNDAGLDNPEPVCIRGPQGLPGGGGGGALEPMTEAMVDEMFEEMFE